MRIEKIDFVNRPNYVQNSYNDCYTMRIPYMGKYYLSSFFQE